MKARRRTWREARRKSAAEDAGLVWLQPEAGLPKQPKWPLDPAALAALAASPGGAEAGAIWRAGSPAEAAGSKPAAAVGRSGRLSRRGVKRAALSAAKSLGQMRRNRRRDAFKVRILCYHGGWLNDDGFQGDIMFIPRDGFARRLDQITALGYQVVTLQEAVDALTGETPPQRDMVAITIDDGWFGTYSAMAPELAARNMPATLYCDTANLLSGLPIAHVMAEYMHLLADPEKSGAAEAQRLFAIADDVDLPLDERNIAMRAHAKAVGMDVTPYLEAKTFNYMSVDQLRELSDFGIDVQLHSHNHSIGDYSAEVVTSEIEQNRDVLSDLLGRPRESFRHFCYPSGRYAPQAFKPLAACGVESATTCELGLAEIATPEDRFHLPRVLDGGNVSEIEFEAELCGFASTLRAAARRLRGGAEADAA